MAEDRIPGEAGLAGLDPHLDPLMAPVSGRPQGGWVGSAAALAAALTGLFLFRKRWRTARFLGGLTLALLEKRKEMGMSRRIREVLTHADHGRAGARP